MFYFGYICHGKEDSVKNYIVIISLLLLIVLAPMKVSASQDDYIVNSQNVHISLSDYDKLLKLFSEKYIDVMTEEEYERIMNMDIDFDNVKQVIKYIRMDYNNITGEITETELTETEFNNFVPINPAKVIER